MYDLTHFEIKETVWSGQELRSLAGDAVSMQQCAGRVVDLLYNCFQTPPSCDASCALVRCFKTHRFAALPLPLQTIVRARQPDQEPSPLMRCLVLLASRGDLPAWNSPQTSLAHRVIPLPTADIVEQAPMIARLIVQMGLTIQDVVHPEPAFLLDLERQTFNVFHIEDAVGSEFIPAQQTFVLPHRIRSVLGFGGILPSGEIFTIVMFAKVHVSRETAELFRTLALSVKLAFLPFAENRVFDVR